MMIMRAVWALALIAPMSQVGAQRLSDGQAGIVRATAPTRAVSPFRDSTLSQKKLSTTKMVLGGLVAAAIAGTAGGYAGHHLSEDCAGFACQAGAEILGVLIGEALGVPLGVHAMGRQGSLAQEVLFSAAIAFGGIMTAPMTFGFSLLAVIPAQIIVSIHNERQGAKKER